MVKNKEAFADLVFLNQFIVQEDKRNLIRKNTQYTMSSSRLITARRDFDVHVDSKIMDINEFLSHLELQVNLMLDEVFSSDLKSILDYFKTVDLFIEKTFQNSELEIKIDLMRLILRMTKATKFVTYIQVLNAMKVDFLNECQIFALFCQVLLSELKKTVQKPTLAKINNQAGMSAASKHGEISKTSIHQISIDRRVSIRDIDICLSQRDRFSGIDDSDSAPLSRFQKDFMTPTDHQNGRQPNSARNYQGTPFKFDIQARQSYRFDRLKEEQINEENTSSDEGTPVFQDDDSPIPNNKILQNPEKKFFSDFVTDTSSSQKQKTKPFTIQLQSIRKPSISDPSDIGESNPPEHKETVDSKPFSNIRIMTSETYMPQISTPLPTLDSSQPRISENLAPFGNLSSLSDKLLNSTANSNFSIYAEHEDPHQHTPLPSKFKPQTTS